MPEYTRWPLVLGLLVLSSLICPACGSVDAWQTNPAFEPPGLKDAAGLVKAEGDGLCGQNPSDEQAREEFTRASGEAIQKSKTFAPGLYYALQQIRNQDACFFLDHEDLAWHLDKAGDFQTDRFEQTVNYAMVDFILDNVTGVSLDKRGSRLESVVELRESFQGQQVDLLGVVFQAVIEDPVTTVIQYDQAPGTGLKIEDIQGVKVRIGDEICRLDSVSLNLFHREGVFFWKEKWELEVRPDFKGAMRCGLLETVCQRTYQLDPDLLAH